MAKKITHFVITIETDTDFKFKWARQSIINILEGLKAVFVDWQKKARVNFTFTETEMYEFSVAKKQLKKK